MKKIDTIHVKRVKNRIPFWEQTVNQKSEVIPDKKKLKQKRKCREAVEVDEKE